MATKQSSVSPVLISSRFPQKANTTDFHASLLDVVLHVKKRSMKIEFHFLSDGPTLSPSLPTLVRSAASGSGGTLSIIPPLVFSPSHCHRETHRCLPRCLGGCRPATNRPATDQPPTGRPAAVLQTLDELPGATQRLSAVSCHRRCSGPT